MAHEELSPLNITPGAIRFNTDSMKLEYFRIGMEGGATSSYAGIGTLAAGEWVQITTDTPDIQTGGTRGLFAGSNPSPDGTGNVIEFINVNTTGNTTDFGDRTAGGRRQIAAMSDRTRAVFAGSYHPMGNTMDFVTIASTGNATDFGDTLSGGTNQVLTEATGISNSTRGLMCGGRNPSQIDVISYITIQSTGNAIDFGNLLEVKRNCGSFQSSTRGVIAGGRDNGGTSLKVIEYVTISTLGNSADFGDLSTAGGQSNMGGSNSVRGIVAGGNPATNAIEYVTISTLGNSVNFGDNTAAEDGMNTMATSPTRACMFGAAAPARTLSYVEIMTTGNAVDFGDFSTAADSSYFSGCSNGHGGLG